MLLLLACARPLSGGATAPLAWIAVEAVPGEGLAGLPPAAGWSWSERAQLNALLVDELAPEALKALGLQGPRLEAGFGGYEGQHNPNLLIWGLSPAEAPALAAALGYVTTQHSVLVVGAGGRGCGQRLLRSEGWDLSAAEALLAQISDAPALGDGYTASSGELYLLQPILGRADSAEGRTEAGLTCAELGDLARREAQGLSWAGELELQFIGNDWLRAPGGEEYLERVQDGAEPRLAELRTRHREWLERRVEASGR